MYDKKPGAGVSLTRRRYAYRLPLDLAAQFEALCEMHPEKGRARVMADLLRLGLAQVTQESPGLVEPQRSQLPSHRQAVYLLNGPFAEFHGLVYKHHLALEKELRMEETPVPVPPDAFELGDTT